MRTHEETSHDIKSLSASTRVLVRLQDGTQFESLFYLYDTSRNCAVFYASRTQSVLANVRILNGSAISHIAETKDDTKPMQPVLSDDGQSLLEGLAKHLTVAARDQCIVVTMATGEARIAPPYTQVEGTGEEMARVQRILTSVRSILPQRQQQQRKKQSHVPVKGG